MKFFSTIVAVKTSESSGLRVKDILDISVDKVAKSCSRRSPKSCSVVDILVRDVRAVNVAAVNVFGWKNDESIESRLSWL